MNIVYSRKDTFTRKGDPSPGEKSFAEETFEATDVSGDLLLPAPALPISVDATNLVFFAPFFLDRAAPGKGSVSRRLENRARLQAGVAVVLSRIQGGPVVLLLIDGRFNRHFRRVTSRCG